MATVQENLQAAAADYAARLAELDTMSITQKAQFNYTAPDGHTFTWSDYRASLAATYEALVGAQRGQSSLIQQAGDPFTILDG